MGPPLNSRKRGGNLPVSMPPGGGSFRKFWGKQGGGGKTTKKRVFPFGGKSVFGVIKKNAQKGYGSRVDFWGKGALGPKIREREPTIWGKQVDGDSKGHP